jgi:hypothetical protein
MEEALEKNFSILGEFGELFPAQADVNPDLIYEELMSTKAILNNFTQEEILESEVLVDPRKKWLMKFMNIMLSILFSTKPEYIPLVGCRMARQSCEIGWCIDSVFGLGVYGHSSISILHDVDEGYKVSVSRVYPVFVFALLALLLSFPDWSSLTLTILAFISCRSIVGKIRHLASR